MIVNKAKYVSNINWNIIFFNQNNDKNYRAGNDNEKKYQFVWPGKYFDKVNLKCQLNIISKLISVSLSFFLIYDKLARFQKGFDGSNVGVSPTIDHWKSDCLCICNYVQQNNSLIIKNNLMIASWIDCILDLLSCILYYKLYQLILYCTLYNALIMHLISILLRIFSSLVQQEYWYEIELRSAKYLMRTENQTLYGIPGLE